MSVGIQITGVTFSGGLIIENGTGGISGGYTVTGEPIYFAVGPNDADQFTLRTTATSNPPAGFTFLGA
jgi:hypothetical protein